MSRYVLAVAPFLERTLVTLRGFCEVLEAWDDPIGFLRDFAHADQIEVVATLGNTAVGGALIARLPALRLICNYGAGYDKIDLDAARARGVAVTNTPAGNAGAVAEFAIGLLIASVRRIREADAGLRGGQWVTTGNTFLFSHELSGRRLGIYGLGEIGQRIARMAAAFDYQIGYHNRRPRPEFAYQYFASLGDLASWADDLVIAARAADDNRHSVSTEIFERLGGGGHVVNVARGSILDEEALLAALAGGKLAGAALDVFASEPEIHPALLTAPNLLLTPHMAAKTPEAVEALDRLFIDNLARYFDNRPLLTPVAF